jgi:hypothetical protein
MQHIHSMTPSGVQIGCVDCVQSMGCVCEVLWARTLWGVRTVGAASPFDRVMVGLGGVQTGCEGVVGRKSLTLGTGPINVSMLFTQSNCHGLSGVALGVV